MDPPSTSDDDYRERWPISPSSASESEAASTSTASATPNLGATPAPIGTNKSEQDSLDEEDPLKALSDLFESGSGDGSAAEVEDADTSSGAKADAEEGTDEDENVCQVCVENTSETLLSVKCNECGNSCSWSLCSQCLEHNKDGLIASNLDLLCDACVKLGNASDSDDWQDGDGGEGGERVAGPTADELFAELFGESDGDE